MNKHSLIMFFFCILYASLGIAQRNALKNNFFKINDSLYVSNEISVKEYLTFIEDKSFNKEYMFDETVFTDTVTFPNQIISANFSGKYFSKNGSYANFPMIGISYYQAMAYCTWLKEKLINSGNVGIKIIRLPTVDEYLSILLRDTIKSVYKADKDTLHLFQRINEIDENTYTDVNSINLSCEILQQENLSGLQDGYLHLASVVSNKEFCNIIGNVSEYAYSDSEVLIWGNNFSGKAMYRNNLSTPQIMLYDSQLITLADKTFKSVKVGFRIVIILNK